MTVTYIKGDATKPVGEGHKYILHICNNKGGWGAGFVLALSKCWGEPEMRFRQVPPGPTLGKTQFVTVSPDITVVNMFAQDGYRSAASPRPLDYNALLTCLSKVEQRAKQDNASIHMPRIGCGLAGGDWNLVEKVIRTTLTDLDVVVYDL